MDNLVVSKSREFAIKVVCLYKQLADEQKEYVLSKQLLRAGTSIGANVREAEYAQSRADFVSKMSIALKEASETEYWLVLLHETGYVSDTSYETIHAHCVSLIKILTSIVKKSK